MGRRGWLAFFFGLVVITGLTLLRAADPYALVVARETTFDTFQQWRPREAPPDLPIRIIDVDEASLAELGQWPWPRSTMAAMAERLTELGAAAIAFDLLFSEPDRLSPASVSGSGEDYDETFAAALAAGPTILSLAQSGRANATSLEPKSGLATTGTDPLAMLPELGGAAQPLPRLAAAAPGLGVASLDRDGAGVARRLPMLWRNGDAVLPTLSAEALRIALGVSTLVVIGDSAGAGTVEQLRIGDFSVPTGPTGDIWLYYRHLPSETYVSSRDLLTDGYEDLAPLIAGQIVLVGASASGLLDIRASTLGVAVPGVSIHAQALEQMLTNIYLVRADWVGGLEMAIFAVAGLLIVLAVIVTGPIVGLVVSLAIGGLLVAISWWAFSVPRLLIDPSFALLGALLLLYAAMAFFRFAVTDADRRRIRRAFAHYVEPSLLTRIEADANLLRLGGDVRELTVMFSDVRNFSALAERTEPSALVAILNRLFAALGAAIVGEQGTIDKFMGDAVMAFWNAPVDVERHAERACRAALAMREALEKLNTTERDPIAIGIGIATGPALVGNMGFESRFDYSCIGDTVNVASRIEGMCRAVGHDILVTEATAAATPNLALLPAGAVELKGMSERESIHILVGDESLAQAPAFAALASAHEKLLADLSSGADHAQSLDACRRAALAVDSRLGSFYAACSARAEDFRISGPARLVG